MGYTHYFTSGKDSESDKYMEALPIVQKILNKYSDIIQYERDDPKPPQCDEELIRFNGIGDDGHETFLIKNGGSDWDFCKTARKPYDIVVCEVLLVLNHFIPSMSFSSDGDINIDDDCWGPAIRNVRQYVVFYGGSEEGLGELDEQDLDEIVHEVASQMATNANNNGYHGQIEFLKVVAGLDEDEILEIHRKVNR